MTTSLYLVGGYVRDELLGVPSKDIDYTVVTPDGWDGMRSFLIAAGFEIFVETPKYLTIRAKFPKDHPSRGITADFVLARKEGEYADGRHPDVVEPGTLEDDLRRRDFTVNAMAKDEDGNLIDLFGGKEDLANRLIRCVGRPEERFGEDALRALRAIRFAITKGMALDASVSDALRSEWLPPLLTKVSVERRSQELLKAFKHDTLATLELLKFFPGVVEATFTDGLWLMPSLRS